VTPPNILPLVANDLRRFHFMNPSPISHLTNPDYPRPEPVAQRPSWLPPRNPLSPLGFMNPFQRFLAATMKNRSWNQVELSRFLGCSQSNVSRWLSGASPRIETVVMVVRMLGGDVQFPEPGSGGFAIVETSGAASDVGDSQAGSAVAPPILGVLAGDGSIIESTKSALLPLNSEGWFEELFSRSHVWGLTQGAVRFVRVSAAGASDSLSEGSLLAVRRTNAQFDILQAFEVAAIVRVAALHRDPMLRRLTAQTSTPSSSARMRLADATGRLPDTIVALDDLFVDYLVVGKFDADF